jgi:hypothetical protein
MNFPPTLFVVEGIVPAEGVTLLCSKPKFGARREYHQGHLRDARFSQFWAHVDGDATRSLPPRARR